MALFFNDEIQYHNIASLIIYAFPCFDPYSTVIHHKLKFYLLKKCIHQHPKIAGFTMGTMISQISPSVSSNVSK